MASLVSQKSSQSVKGTGVLQFVKPVTLSITSDSELASSRTRRAGFSENDPAAVWFNIRSAKDMLGAAPGSHDSLRRRSLLGAHVEYLLHMEAM